MVIVVQDGKDMVDVLILEDVIVEDGDGGMDVGIKTNQLHHVANKYIMRWLVEQVVKVVMVVLVGDITIFLDQYQDLLVLVVPLLRLVVDM